MAGLRRLDPPVTTAAVAGMILSTVLLDQLLFTNEQPRPDRERVITELSAMTLRGIGYRATSPSWEG
jgi:hypothetical protein